MKRFFLKICKSIHSTIKHMILWNHVVLKKHNNYKLSVFHKLRAIRYGFSSDFYHMYNLEKNNPRDYISDYVRMLSRDINDKYKSILDNKIIFEKIFSNYLTIPKNIIIILDDLYTDNGILINENELNSILENNKYIIKPIADTGGGSGVALIQRIENDIYIFNNKRLTSRELYKELLKHKNYIITEFVNQHEYSKRINPNSVNTIRIITIKDPTTKQFIVPCATHRFGSKNSNVVDNASSGGYVTKIDIIEGVLMDTTSFSNVKMYDKHPDTGVKIKGIKIPHWDEILDTLINVANRFQYIPLIVWDVVVTDKGFTVIEGNTSSGLGLFQVFGSIKNTKLGEFYKYYGYMK